jgi:hypothetical protein
MDLGEPVFCGETFVLNVVSSSTSSCSIQGASLIKPKFVLTAAHCTSVRSNRELFSTTNLLTNPDQFQGSKGAIVILGAHNITDEKEPGQIWLKVSPYWILSHNLFWPHTFTNDIALIQLPTPVKLTEFIQTVGLPISTDIFVGQEVI